MGSRRWILAHSLLAVAGLAPVQAGPWDSRARRAHRALETGSSRPVSDCKGFWASVREAISAPRAVCCFSQRRES